MLSFSDVTPGERLVVRYRLSDVRTGEHFSDALGELQEVTEQSVTIQTRTELVRIPARRSPTPSVSRLPGTASAACFAQRVAPRSGARIHLSHGAWPALPCS